MAAVVYPTTLPAPSLWGGVARERRALSGPPGNTQLRNRTRDALNDIDSGWMYTSAEMAIWRAWYEDTLLDGMRWFAITVPGAGGWIQRVAKFRTKTLRAEYLGSGVYRVSAQMQQRGTSAAPQVIDVPWAGIARTDTWLYKSVARGSSDDYSAKVYDDTAWPSGPAPFGDAAFDYGNGWPYPATILDVDSDTWLRKHVSLTSLGPIAIALQADNIASLWVNGAEVPLVQAAWLYSGSYTPTQLSLVFAVRVTESAPPGPGNHKYAALEASQ